MTHSIVAPRAAAGAVRRIAAAADRERQAYRVGRHGEGAHLAAAATYGVLVLATVALGRSRGVRAPSLTPWDTACLAAATFKASRLLAKDSITEPLRVPFTQRAEDGDANEVNDEPRGTGVRHTVGEVLTCPFCLGQWVGTGLLTGLAFAPRSSRVVTTLLTAIAGSDFLHHAHTATQQTTRESPDE